MGEELKRVVAYKLLSADRDTVIDGLMEMVFAVGDVTWVSERLCEQADSADTGVSSLAITCFGHLARLHQQVGGYVPYFPAVGEINIVPLCDDIVGPPRMQWTILASLWVLILGRNSPQATPGHQKSL